jgi:hypothetical protein
VGKYLEKGHTYRGEQFKGARMVRYSRGWKSASARFSWVSPAAHKWRSLVGEMVKLCRGQDIDVLSKRFGRHWAFKALQILEEFPDSSPRFLCQALDRTSSPW